MRQESTYTLEALGAQGHQIEVGPLSATWEGDRLHTVCWYGVEVFRGISGSVRDANWGTVPETVVSLDIVKSEGRVILTRLFNVGPKAARGEMTIELCSSGKISVEWRLVALTRITVNRAGLCILHPLVGVEGTPVRIRHEDDRESCIDFPARISPTQPAMNIVGLSHSVFGTEIDTRFLGEIFEMEDQRNWSDASYKTYCRPLSYPWPFNVEAGEEIHHRIEITLKGKPEGSLAAGAAVAHGTMPEIQLAIEPGWASTPVPNCTFLARFDGREWSKEMLAHLKGHDFDAEIVVPSQADAHVFISDFSSKLEAHGLKPRHVIALPHAYLKSYQPNGPWPDGLTPDACFAAVSKAFPDASIGVGMLTNFTEFNRCRPVEGAGDYITHGNAAIVHAADDLSVQQTLEALPSIFASARAIGGSRDYRLGLVSIGMRTNPYGMELSQNPDGKKITMTDADPRQFSDFAAAYAIAVVAQAVKSGVASVCLGALSGPFSIKGPLGRAVSALAGLTGHDVSVEIEDGMYTIASEDTRIVANMSVEERTYVGRHTIPPASWQIFKEIQA